MYLFYIFITINIINFKFYYCMWIMSGFKYRVTSPLCINIYLHMHVVVAYVCSERIFKFLLILYYYILQIFHLICILKIIQLSFVIRPKSRFYILRYFEWLCWFWIVWVILSFVARYTCTWTVKKNIWIFLIRPDFNLIHIRNSSTQDFEILISAKLID